MKPKFHFSPGTQHARGEKQGSNARKVVTSVAAISLVMLAAPYASAATIYTIKPSATQLDWNTYMIAEIPAIPEIPYAPAIPPNPEIPGDPGTPEQPFVPGVPAVPAVPGNWTPDLVGQYPGTAVDDTAWVTGAFGGVAQTVDISATLANPLLAMTLGDTSGTGTTTVKTTNASSLPLKSGANILSQGPLVAPANANIISAPLILSGGLNIAVVPTPVLPAVATTSNTDLTISGKITPSAQAARTITNAGPKTVTFGDIDISVPTAAANTVLTMANSLATGKIILNGVISDGDPDGLTTFTSGLTIANGVNGTVFQINVANTYTGPTSLVNNTRATTFLINTDNPFGTTGSLYLSQQNAVNTVQALNANRSIGNPVVTMARSGVYTGAYSLTYTGAISCGSSMAITNNLTAPAQLVLNGRFNTENSNTGDSRIRSFGGTGTTVFNGIIADAAIPNPDMRGGINVSGTGTVIINNTATTQGDFRVTGGGTLQLGSGGTTGTITPDFPTTSADDYLATNVPPINDPKTVPDFVKSSVVTGGTTATTTGALAVNHSDDIPLSSTINGNIGLKQIGSGVLTVATPQFNTGNSQVGDGVNPSKLVVTAGAMAETTQTGDFFAPSVPSGSGYVNFYQEVTNLGDTSVLRVGQPVYITTASAAIYIHSIDSPTQITLMGTGITGTSNGLIANLAGQVFGQVIKFGAGSSLGTTAGTTTVNALSTLAGTGVISGAVTVGGILDPGMSIGTMSTGPLKFNGGSTLKVEINTSNLTSDKVVVTGNVLAGGSPILALTDLGADVALADGTKFVLIDYSGTYSTASTLTYLGNPVPNNSSITLGANTYHVNYADPAEGGTALTLTVGPAAVPTAPYEVWIASYTSQLPTFSDVGPTLDPDNDSRDNLLEFALNGNPGSGSDDGKMVVSTEDSGDVGSDRDLSITMAVRNSAVLGAGVGGSATLTIDGIVYTIQGSQALQAWDSAVSEVSPASTLVPAPDAGWTTRTFKVTDSDGLPDKRFIRVGVE